MRTSFFASLLLALGAPFTGKAQTLASEEPAVASLASIPGRGYWSIRLDAEGQAGDFALDVQRAESVVARDWEGAKGRESVELAAGKSPLGKVRVASLPPAYGKVAGVLGRDVLGRYALGFDRRTTSLQLTLWKGGRTEAQAAAWFGVPAARAALKTLPDGQVAVETSLRGKPLWLVLDTARRNTLFGSKVSVEGDLPVPSGSTRDPDGSLRPRLRGLTQEFEIAGGRLPFMEYSCDAYDVGLADGRVGLFGHPSQRVLVDLASSALWVERLDADELLSRQLLYLLRLPVRVKGEALVVGNPQLFPSGASVVPYLDLPYLRLGEFDAVETLAVLRGAGRLAKVRELSEMSRLGYRALFKVDETQAIPITIDPLNG